MQLNSVYGAMRNFNPDYCKVASDSGGSSGLPIRECLRLIYNDSAAKSVTASCRLIYDDKQGVRRQEETTQ